MNDNDQDTDDKYFSDLYAELSQEEPSTALDEKILSKARKELEQDSEDAKAHTASGDFSRQGVSPFAGRWSVPVSLAAVIMLSVTVVVLIEKERPYQLTSSPDAVAPAEQFRKIEEPLARKPVLNKAITSKEEAESRKVEKKKKETVRSGAGDRDVAQFKRRAELNSSAIVSQAQPDSKVKSEVSKAKPKLDSSNDQLAREGFASAGAIESKATKNTEEKLTKAPRVARKVVSAESLAVEDKTQGEQTPASAAVKLAEPSTETSEETVVASENEMTVAKARPGNVTKRQDLSNVEMARQSETMDVEEVESEPTIEPAPVVEDGEAAESASEKQPEMAVPQEPAVAAGQKNFVTAPAQSSRLAVVVSENTDQESCSALSVADCLQSRECTLEVNKDKSGYSCRVAKSQCEKDFSQANDSQETCESRPGCKFQPAKCFCPPGVDCVCGGGNPAACIAE